MRHSSSIPSARRRGSPLLFGLACVGALLLFPTVARADTEIGRRWAASAPVIDGSATFPEWGSATFTLLAHARLRTMNDGSFLYILLDVVDDTTNDPPTHAGPNTGDYYVLAVDPDLNKAVTPNVDFFYDVCNDGRLFIKAFYLGGSASTGCQATSALSAAAIGFGGTLHSATPHRFWEFRLDLGELGVDTTTWTTSSGSIPRVRMNIATISENPPFSTAQPDPSPFPDLSNTFQIDLATSAIYPAGTAGPVFAGVGLVPSTPPYIEPSGHANINIPGYYTAIDAPFGGNLNIFGHWNTLFSSLAARSYRVLYSKDGGPVTHLRQTWTNFRFNFITRVWDPVAIGPDANDRYAIPSPFTLWYLNDLLASWQSGAFGDGTYTFSLELFDLFNNPIPFPVPLAGENHLTLFVDNTRPAPKINTALYSDGGGPLPDPKPVCACAIVTQGDASGTGFHFDISVTDAHGALNSVGLSALYGDNQSSFVYADNYGGHVDADGVNQWNGFTNLVVPNGGGQADPPPLTGPWRAVLSCAHTFHLAASSRTQNGYGLVFPHVGYNVSLTIELGTGFGSFVGCSGPDPDSVFQYGPAGAGEPADSAATPAGSPQDRRPLR